MRLYFKFSGKATRLFVILVLILALLFLISYLFLPEKIKGEGGVQIRIGDAEWQVELVNDDFSRARGLSGRDFLAENKGMLFVFPDARQHAFWMKGMKFALDIIWINQNKVVDISENLPPLTLDNVKTYSPSAPANLVLEVNAGQIAKRGIKIGDEVSIYQNGVQVAY